VDTEGIRCPTARCDEIPIFQRFHASLKMFTAVVMRPAPSAVTPASAAPDFSSGGVRPAFSAVACSDPQDRQGSYKAPRLIANAAVSRLRAIFITDYKAKRYPIRRCSDYSSANSKSFVHKEIRLEPAVVGLYRLFERLDITRMHA
jgi:hypothetical protein